MISTGRRLLARLRELMAHDSAPLPEVARLVAAELVSEVCSIYAVRAGEVLELRATEGLRAEAIGRTRLRVGEGIVGLAAATGHMLNLPDAQNHPAFAYRPETGEEKYASMVAVPVRRAGRVVGVLAVQSRTPRRYDAEETEVLETVAMLLAEMLVRPPGGARPSEAPEEVADTMPRRFAGVALAPGIVLGRLVILGSRTAPHALLADDPALETARVRAAIDRMQADLDRLITARLPAGDAPREVLEAYRLVAADAGWLRRVEEAIQGGLTAEAAVERVAGDLHDRVRRIADPYLRERLSDLEDLAGRLLDTLAGSEESRPAEGAILLARRLGPAELLDWHARGIVGLVIEEGSPAGHAAILARALGLPALGGVRDVMDAAAENEMAVLDAEEAQLILRPEHEVRQAYARALAGLAERQAQFALIRDRPGKTADGTRLRLMLNIGLTLELPQLEVTGAEGIGLFRSEIAMLARGSMLDTAEQAAIYGRVMDAAGGKPVLFRTLDLGGDKLLPGGGLPEEENPAMGWRSLRVGLDRPSILRKQVRALLEGADGRQLSVMFPMVATVAEFRAARAILMAEAKRFKPAPEVLAAGTMLEIPALLWQLPELLAEVDFVSLGTNDLMQFLFAADRGTPTLAGRYDALSPAMLDVLEQVRVQADAAGVPVSVCGEIAARPLEALALAAIGLTSLSMPAGALLAVKSSLAAVDLAAFRPVLAQLRRNAAGTASLREPIAAWAREHGMAD